MSASRQTSQPLLIRGCDVLTQPGMLREGVDLALAGGRVAWVAPAGMTEPPTDAELVDGRALLAIPGLVNAHTHSPENCLRGFGEGLPLEPWLLRMFASSGSYSPEDHYACALAGALEALLTGTTAVIDHLWTTSPNAECVEAALRAYRDAGIRAAVAPLVGDADDTDRLASTLGVELGSASFARRWVLPADELCGRLADLMDRWHGADGGRLRVLAGPAGVQWCTDELLVGLAETARAHGSGLHLHLLETRLQEQSCRLRFGVSAVRGLDALGLLGPDCSLAHAVWLEHVDVGLISERRAVVVHNPAANLRLGSGKAPVPDLLAAGATVGLGTDGSASSDSQVLWAQMRLAALIHHDGEGPGVGGIDALRMAMAGGAAALGLPQGGTLEPGAPADVVLLSRAGDGLAGAVVLEGALALSEDGRGVRHVIVDGRLVVRDGRCLTIDADAARAELRARARARMPAASAPPPADVHSAMERLAALRRALRERSFAAGSVPR